MSLATTTDPPRQAIAAIDRSKPLQVTGKLRKALDAMFTGASREDAAKAAGMTDHSLRSALKKPHVKRYYLDELEVLRTGERVRNFYALREVRDQKANAMARVNAIAAMEREAEQGVSGGTVRAGPGITIVIEAAADRAPIRQVDGKPLDLQADPVGPDGQGDD
jgi:hypothetical protein